MSQPTQHEINVLATLKLMEKSLGKLANLPKTSSSQQQNNQQNQPKKSNKKSKADLALEAQMSNAANSLAGLAKRQKDFADALAEKIKYTKEEQKNSVEGKKALEAYNKALADRESDLRANSSLSLKTYEYQKLLNKQLVDQESALRHSVVGTNLLSTTLGRAQRNASLLGASLIETNENFKEGTAEYSAWITEITESSKGLNSLGNTFLKSAGIIDDITGEMRDNISPRDFAGLRLKLGEAQETISESFAGLESLGVSGLNDALKKITEMAARKQGGAAAGWNGNEDNAKLDTLRHHLKSLAEELVRSDISMGKFAYMFDEHGKMTEKSFEGLDASAKDLGEHINEISKTLDKTASEHDSLGRSANTAAGKLDVFFLALKKDPTGFMMEKLKGQLGTTASILGGLSKMASGLKATYNDAVDFNAAQVPASFMDVQAASVRMGMSFKDTTKFMQENKRMLAIYGGDFNKQIGDTKSIFAKFGYNMEQASEFVGPAIEAGISSGINVKSGDALNKFIDQSMDSFKDISGIANVTAKEFLKLNAELLNQQDVAGVLIGMDASRAQEQAKNLISLRNEYVQRGLLIESAQELLKIHQQQQREKVASKVGNAAKGALIAQYLGLGDADSSRYRQLSMNTNRSTEEDEEMQEISNKMGVAYEKKRIEAADADRISGGEGNSIAFASLFEGIGLDGAAKTMMDKGVEFAKAKRAGTDISAGDARAKADQAQGSEKLADLSNASNSLASIFNNTLSTAAIGAATALAGVALQGRLGGLGGLLGRGARAAGSVAQTASAGATGLMSRGLVAGKGLLSGAGKLLGKAALPLAVAGSAYGAYSSWSDASDAEANGEISHKEATKKKGGAVGGAAGGIGGAMGGMAAGAAIGSVIPIVGTVIGGAIGAAIGGFGGSAIGESLGEGITGLFQSDDTAEIKTSELTEDGNKKLVNALENLTGALTGKSLLKTDSSSPATSSLFSSVSSILPGLGMMGSIFNYVAGGLMDTSADNQITGIKSNVALPGAMKVPYFAQPGEPAPQAAINTKITGNKSTEQAKSTDALIVSDLDANVKLGIIAENLANAVTILQQIAASGSSYVPAPITKQPMNVQDIPSSYSYVTGRTQGT